MRIKRSTQSKYIHCKIEKTSEGVYKVYSPSGSKIFKLKKLKSGELQNSNVTFYVN